ncbi:LytTR family transcriptional regulator DNA-binding domain-containing protein [Eudoraea chungangensis]|uniref:LytTR family transcriptional regulator DNA-binding domain-containing protein n=1 Tax=Eudoraea chungangensis TaxID=1481905 RepID=UPI0023EDD593|nr:LytTR family transcriptional regulator DNA-binding domain-containing protein [Eudoraea chungangensis]
MGDKSKLGMKEFVNKKIPFNHDFKSQAIIAALLGCILASIMIFLRPFDTDGFDSEFRNLTLSGFGFLFSLAYLINARLERRWYILNKNVWTIKDEVFSFISLVLISSVPIHAYNQIFLNNFFSRNLGFDSYIEHGIWFFANSLIPIMVFIFPFYLYFRNRVGKSSSSESPDEITFMGLNKEEKIVLLKNDVLFVKSSENYVEIFYEQDGSLNHSTFRNTLREINKQAPFLKRCHRSYLINLSNIKAVNGNSHNASLEFKLGEISVPLSYKYYKQINSSLHD